MRGRSSFGHVWTLNNKRFCTEQLHSFNVGGDLGSIAMYVRIRSWEAMRFCVFACWCSLRPKTHSVLVNQLSLRHQAGHPSPDKPGGHHLSMSLAFFPSKLRTPPTWPTPELRLEWNIVQNRTLGLWYSIAEVPTASLIRSWIGWPTQSGLPDELGSSVLIRTRLSFPIRLTGVGLPGAGAAAFRTSLGDSWIVGCSGRGSGVGVLKKDEEG